MSVRDNDISRLKNDIEELKIEIDNLQKWKEHCTLAAAGWGGVCMAVITIGGIINQYWEAIKHYFASQK